MVTPPMQIEEVDHVSVLDPIDQVADGASENAGQRYTEVPLLGSETTENDEQQDKGADGNGQEEWNPHGPGHIREQAECGPRVTHVREIEDALDHRHRLVHVHGPLDTPFGELVQGYDSRDCRHDHSAARAHPLTTASHLSQISGWPPARPTDVR